MFNQIKPSYKCGALAYNNPLICRIEKCSMHANVVKVCLEFHISYSDILMKTVNFYENCMMFFFYFFLFTIMQC